MRSNFALAREHLGLAWLHLNGDDEVSRQAREEIDLLIETLAVAEYGPGSSNGNLIQFPVPRTAGQR
jgi:hypothetical protein